MNDTAGDRYTDAYLLGHGRITHAEIQEAFASRDIPFGETVDTTNFSYTTPNSTITIGNSVLDLYEPVEVWQRQNTSSDWMWVNKVFRIGAPPANNPYQYLTDWDWSNEQINVIPASQTMLIMARYVKQMARAADSTVKLTVTGFYLPFVAGVCWRASLATLRIAQSQEFRQEYYTMLERAVLRASRRMQGVVSRWGGYRARPGGGMTTPLINL